MRASAVLVGFLAILVSTWGVGKLIRTPPEQETKELPPKPNDEMPPLAAPPGPYPKAVVDQTEFTFGRMETGDEGTKDFEIRNEGEAPLVLKEGPKTCQCTIGNIQKDQILPGQSAKVTLSWKPTVQSEMFEKGVTIYTNDPENRAIELKILGIVSPRVMLVPENVWNMPDVRENSVSEGTGMLISLIVERFSILGFECADPNITAEAVEITDKDRLETLRGLCGYEIRVRVSPDMPVGPFGIPLTIKTDLPYRDSTKVFEPTVIITGNRRGPIRLVGKEYIQEKSAIALGNFDALLGRKLRMTLVSMEDPESGLEFTGVVCDPPELTARLEPDANSKGAARRYFLELEYPPGAPRITRIDENPGKITVNTNHPRAPQVQFHIFFTAF